jgi:ribosomal protein L29
MNKDFEQFKLKSVDELLKTKKAHVKDVAAEIAKLASSGKKSSKRIKDLKKEVAWIETLISAKITEVQAGN